MKCVQTGVAFSKVVAYKASFNNLKLNNLKLNNLKLNNLKLNNLKYQNYRLGKIGFHDLFKGILT
jgi:hypothetical protein